MKFSSFYDVVLCNSDAIDEIIGMFEEGASVKFTTSPAQTDCEKILRRRGNYYFSLSIERQLIRIE